MACPRRTAANNAEEMIEQQRNVFAPLAQRRNHDVDDIEPVVESSRNVLSRRRLIKSRLVAAMTRTSTRVFARSDPDALNLAVLEEPQQQRLHLRRSSRRFRP